MANMESLLEEALRRINAHVRSPLLTEVGPDTDVFSEVDSLAIVDLLLETEALLEKEHGRYVTLAGETMFDAEKSPLKRWADWVAYVERRYAE